MADHRNDDEVLLIDFLLGRCEGQRAGLVARRLQEDGEFRKLHDDLRNALTAMKLLPELAPPEGLAQRTVERLRQVRSTEALIAREELSRRSPARRVFSLRDVIAAAAAVIVLGVVLFSSGGDILRSLGGAQRAMQELCLANQQQIGQAVAFYAADNAGFLPVSSAEQRPWLGGPNQQAASNSEALFRLAQQGYAQPEVFQCPGVSGRSPGKFAMQAGMTDFPASRFVGYSYQYAMGQAPSVNDPQLRTAVGEMAILADSNPLFSGGRFQPSRLSSAVSDNHHKRGQNVLYLDQHAQWTKTAAAGVGGNNIYLADGVYNYTGDETPAGPTDTFLLPTYAQR